MTRYIKTYESYKTFRAQQSRSQQNLTAEGGEENASNLVLGKGWSQDACRRAVTKIIIMGELSLNFVDNKGFRHFYSVATRSSLCHLEELLVEMLWNYFLKKR